MVHLSNHARPGPSPRGLRRRTVGTVLALGLAAAGVSAASPSASASGERQLNVAIVGNPQMEDIAALTPDLFTAETGIEVEYTVLEEGTLREVVTRDVGAGGEQFDVVMIGMYEAPQFGANGWLVDLTPYAEGDEAYNIDDLIPSVRSGLSVDDALYASPFYAESSFLMYRQDVMDEAGIEMPANPTWDEVAEIARQVDSDEMAGICLRGKPGWGDLGAAFTTVLNTFGATWWSANEDGSIGEAQIDQPEFREALEFYAGLINDAGEDDAANASFNECLAQYRDGQRGDVVRRHRGRRPAGGRRQRGQGAQRLRHGAGQGDRGVWVVVGLDSGNPADFTRSRHCMGVHLLGHRSGVHRRSG